MNSSEWSFAQARLKKNEPSPSLDSYGSLNVTVLVRDVVLQDQCIGVIRYCEVFKRIGMSEEGQL
jgi:hypothetical protein